MITGAKGTEAEERNRAVVLGFYDTIVNAQQYDRWPEFIDPNYIQHKPNVPDGPDGVLNFIRWVYSRVPTHRAEIVRCFADGDFVMLHVHIHNEPHAGDISVMDIFRLENGKLIEHWDVDQPLPAADTYKNANSMF